MAKRRQGQPLRIVLHEPSGRGGICHYTYQLAESLSRQGCDVTVVTTTGFELGQLPRSFRTEFLYRASLARRLLSALRSPLRRKTAGAEPAGRRDSGLSLRSLRVRLLQTILAFKLLWRRPDIVHFQSISRGRDLYFVRLLVLLGFRVICTAHDLLPHDSTSDAERKAHGATYRIVGRVIVHAESNRRELIELFHVDPARISVIPHGSYNLLVPEGQMPKRIARERVGLPAQGRIVLFFGLIKRYKGLEFLVEAFRRVKRRIPDSVLVIVGDVFRTDAEGHAFYWRLIEEVSRQDNVYCVPEYVPIERVGPYLSSADVIVLPYTKTYQSGVLLSAYAAGRPVVVTDTGGLPETVLQGKTGLVVPPRDPDALAAAIERILENPEMADAMGKAASRLADTDYSWQSIAARTVDLYFSMVDESRARLSTRLSTGEQGRVARDAQHGRG